MDEPANSEAANPEADQPPAATIGPWTLAGTPHRYFTVDRLGDEAQRIIRDLIQRNRPAPEIRAEVIRRTGQQIALRSLQHYATRFRQVLRGREEACTCLERIVETHRRMGVPLSVAVQAELLEVLDKAAKDGKLREMGLYAVGRLAVALADSERKKRELELRCEIERRKVQVLERRLELIVEKSRPASPAGEGGAGPQISPAEAIREIFGIKDEK